MLTYEREEGKERKIKEATRAIRSGVTKVLNPKLPIIALTANVMTDDQERCRFAGMDDYLSKPFSKESLLVALERC